MTERSRYMIAAIILAAVLLLGHLLLPMNTDSSVYQTMAQDLVHYHKLPYLGSWDENFPGIIFIHALGILLFGSSDIGFATVIWVINIGSGLLLFLICSRYLSNPRALCCTILFALFYIHSGYWINGQRDVIACFFVLLALYCALEKRSGWLIPCAGLAMGSAMLIRPTMVFAAIVILWWIAKRRTSLRQVVSYVLFAALPAILFCSMYLGHLGGLQEVYTSVIRFNLDVYSPAHSSIFDILAILKSHWLILVLSILGIAASLKQRLPEIKLFYVTIILSLLLSPVVMRKAMEYQYFPFFASLIPCATEGLFTALKPIQKLASRFGIDSRVQYVAFGLALTLISLKVMSRDPIVPFLRSLPDRGFSGSLEQAQSTYIGWQGFFNPVFDARSERKVVRYLANRLGQNEPFEYATLWPGLTWRLDRPQATRFTMFYSLCMTRPDGSFTDYQKRWRLEYVETIAHVQPKYLIIAHGSKNDLVLVPDLPVNLVHTIPGFDAMIDSLYKPDTTIDEFALYRRKT